ncbi:MAG: DUF5808 domain-containing protein [Turicibacter sp.]
MVYFIFGFCFVMFIMIALSVLIPASKPRNGTLFSLKLSEEHLKDERVLQLIKGYKQAIWLYVVISSFLFIPVFLLDQYASFATIYFLIVFIFICLAIELPYMIYHQKLKTLKLNNSWTESNALSNKPEDDEFNWRYGVYYVNPNDKRFMVTRKFGMGMTVNLGHKTGKQFMIGSIVFTLFIIVGCMFPVLRLELSDPKITLTETGKLDFDYTQYSSSVYLTDINEVTLLDTIPMSYRLNGMSTDRVMRGYYKLKEYGKGMAYIYKTEPPYILVTTDGGIVFFNEKSEQETLTLYETLTQAIDAEGITDVLVSGGLKADFVGEAEITVFMKAINNATEIEGVLDVSASDYDLEINYHKRPSQHISLWLSADDANAMIMYEEDSHVGYAIKEEDKVNLLKLLND